MIREAVNFVRRGPFFVVPALILCVATWGIAACGELGVADEPDNSGGANNGGVDEPVPVEGTYRVLTQTRNDSGCESEGTPHDGVDFFALQPVDESRSAIGLYSCKSAEDCEASGEPEMRFDELYESQKRWRGTELDWEENGSACELNRRENIVDLGDEQIELQSRVYGGEMSEAEQCNEEIAEEQQANLICERYDVMIATPVE